MKRHFLLSLFLLTACSIWAASAGFSNETLPYKVMFKWGLVNKQAGTATLSLRNDGTRYQTSLVARSQPWADKIYSVRDTLLGTMQRDGLKPLRYEKRAHESSEFKHDVVKFSYTGSRVKGSCSRYVEKKGKVTVNNHKTELEAYGTTLDMLSSFYYMRTLPYQDWKPGHTVTVNIFSGKRKELLTIKYHGIETVKSSKRQYKCYHITFIFTGENRTKTSDDMDAWISVDAHRIPIRLEGSLPVGKVHCVYDGE